MATYQTSFLYELDENGNSATGKVDGLVSNGSADAVEATDDGVVQVGESFDISFSDPTTNASYGGSYTYIGHATPFSGFIAESGGQYYMFSNDDIPVGINLNGFIAEDIPVCFTKGTHILTPSGEVPVESLRAGDLVVARHRGRIGIKPLVWVGHMEAAIPRGTASRRAAPVTFRAGALGDGVPFRDLRVSPEHAVLVDDVLVPAGLLVNGQTILQESHRHTESYYHLELEEHGLLLADGAWSESYLDDANRHLFGNIGVTVLPAGEDRTPARRDGRACLPMVRTGIALDRIRAALGSRAGSAAATEARHATIPRKAWS